MLQIVRWVLVAVAIGIIIWLVARTTRRARELDRRIEEYHKEQEEHPGIPYAALAEMLSEQQEADGATALNKATARFEMWLRDRFSRWRRTGR
jgi:vacuolar-type H+-ATPase catalytic subunit A/Vma1